MAAQIVELNESPRMANHFKDSRIERFYKVHGTTNELEALSLAMVTAPGAQLVDGYLLTKVHFDTEYDDYGVWKITAEYSRQEAEQPPEDPLQEGESTYEFDTTGNNVNIKQSLGTQSYYLSAAYNDDNFHGAINVNQDRTEVAGVDIVLPTFSFSESHAFPDLFITQTYKITVESLTGKINSAPFKGFAEGEVLFLGARGSMRRSDSIWTISYSFAVSRGLTNATIAGMSGINKKGWQYMWFHYNKWENPAGTVVLKASSAHVEDVYESGNFAQLLIGS